MIEVRLNVKLHAGQQAIHNNKARFKVIKAGKRFGKSHWATFEITKLAFDRPGGTFWYIAPTYGQAEDIAWQSLLELIPDYLIVSKRVDKLTVVVTGGARIILKGAENENSLRGPALDGVIFDEAAYINQYIWPNIIRGQLAKSKGPAYFISSPNKTGANWYTNFCKEAERKMMSGDPDWAYFYNTIYDNPTLEKSEIDGIREGCAGDQWDLEYMAMESAFSGLRFKEFDFAKNVGELNIVNGLTVRGLDWGIDHPTVCLWGTIDAANKKLYVYDEYVKSGMTIPESSKAIVEMSRGKNIEWSVIDPSTAKRNSQTGRSDKDEFARHGITCLPADNRDVGYDVVNVFLKQLTLIIHPRCKNLISELRTVQYGQKDGDDCTDALRYMCMRVNDFVNGMNIMDLTHEPKIDVKLLKPNERSYYDERIFPPVQEENPQTWMWEGVDAY